MRASASDPTVLETLRDEDLLPRASQPNTPGKWAVLSSYVQATALLGRRVEIRDFYPLTLEALETGFSLSPVFAPALTPALSQRERE